MKCDKCVIPDTLKHPCLMGRGCKVNAKVMFIQDVPLKMDDNSGKVFSGKLGEKLEKRLERRTIDTSKVYFTYLVKCALSNPSKANVQACREYLEDEIEMVNPDIIVPMGNESLKYCVGQVGLTKMRGNAQEVELMGRTRIILPMLDPSKENERPAYKDYIRKDMNTLQTLCTNGMTQVVNTDYRYLETLESIKEEIDRLKREAKDLVFDIETTGKSPYMDYSKIVCISLTDKPRYGVVIPLYKHDSPLTSPEIEQVVELLRGLLEDESIPKCAHNGKFDVEWLRERLNINVANFNFDTMLAHYLCITEDKGTQGLKSQAWEFTDMGGYDNELDDYVKTLSDGEGLAARHNYDRVPWHILRTYAAADVDCCFRLMQLYKPKIYENEQWAILMDKILMPGSYALVDVESNGMKIDMTTTQRYTESYDLEIKRIKAKLESFSEVSNLVLEKRELYKEREKIKAIPKKDRTPEEQKRMDSLKKYQDFKFNFGSVAHLKELLYDKMGLTTTVKTDKGEPSTNEEAMKELAEHGHKIPLLLLELRKVTTLNNMFIQKLPTLRDSNDVIHTSFNMTGTITGRLSSEAPNFQQIPRKVENPELFQYHNEPKALFVSRFGDSGCIMNADYAALEMRIAAIISNDKKMQKALLSGADIHKANASYIFKVPVEEVTKEQRTAAKSLGFGIVYGKSGASFAEELYYDPTGNTKGKFKDLERAKKEGFKLVDHFLGTFTGLRDWIEETKELAHRKGYVETMFGRRRRLPNITSVLAKTRAEAERQAINAPIQGTGSDLTMLSLIQINQWLKDNNMRSKIIATVHDSIVFDVYTPELHTLAPMVKQIMENVHKPYIKTIVPIRADLELGANYGATFEVDLSEIANIYTREDFKEWNKRKTFDKYVGEVKYLQKVGKTLKYVKKFCEDHHRPWDKIIEAME